MELKTLKGFKDFLPKEEVLSTHIINQISKVLSSYNFERIETPTLEYSSVLLKKSGEETEKQVYRFIDNGGRDVALRFDLTVPFARFIALNLNKIKFPFRRSQIGKVFRGENTQKGRYREFRQFDFDIVGDESAKSDFEILCVAFFGLQSILLNKQKDLNNNFLIHYSHVNILTSFFEKLGVLDKSIFILRTIDKLNKIGTDKTKDILRSEIDIDSVEKILNIINFDGNFTEKINYLKNILGENEGISRVEEIYHYLKSFKIESYFNFDLKIARGLDYYTGIIFETELVNSNVGSVCSGGRYDNLIDSVSNSKTKISGVGGSFGVDRIRDILDSDTYGYIKTYILNSTPKVLIVNLDKSLEEYYYLLANKFRVNNDSSFSKISSEVYLKNKNGRNIKDQIDYALSKDIRFLIFVGQDEIKINKIKVKDLTKKEEKLLDFDEAFNLINLS